MTRLCVCIGELERAREPNNSWERTSTLEVSGVNWDHHSENIFFEDLVASSLSVLDESDSLENPYDIAIS